MAALPLFPDDPIDAIMGVMSRAFDPHFGEAWNRRQVADALILGTCRYALIAADGAIVASDANSPGDSPVPPAVGFFLARHVLDDEELLLFAVESRHRRRGLGGNLLDYFCNSSAANGMRRIFLEMRAGNPAARLYESRGFRLVGKRPAYYRGDDGISRDALTYQRLLAAI